MIETIFSLDGENTEPGTEQEGGEEETPEETPSEEPASRLNDGEEEADSESGEDA